MMATEASSLEHMIAEAREMQASGRYINGRVFHALVAEIGRLQKEVIDLEFALECRDEALANAVDG